MEKTLMLIDEKGKKHLAVGGSRLETDLGIFQVPGDVGPGLTVESHKKSPALVITPSTSDYVRKMERPTRIPHFEDIGYLLAQAGLREGQTVLEAGTGSGACAIYFSQAVGTPGRVISFERREDILQAATRNVTGFGAKNIDLVSGDIRSKPEDLRADLVFLDLASPSEYLELARRSVNPGGLVAAHVPFLEEGSRCLVKLKELGFNEVTMTEIMRRDYEALKSGTRPLTTQTVHTGYLTMGRSY